MTVIAPVEFGAFLFTSRYPGQSDGEVLARAVAAAQAAESAGFDQIWVTEHHFVPFGVNPSGLAFAGYLLGATSTIRVGTAVTILPLHSPVHVAEQAALLHHLSGGRFELGVGRAQPVVDYEAIGQGVRYWQQGLAEALDLTIAALSGEVAADSDLYRFRPVRPEPTAPQLPMLVAANSANSVDLAARRGLPMLLFFDKDPATKAALIAQYAQLAAQAGQPTERPHAMALYTQVTDTEQEADRLFRERTVPQFVRANANYQLLLDVPRRVDPNQPVEQVIDRLTDGVLASHPVGPVGTCVRRLVAQIRTSGCRRVLCQVEASGEADAVLANIKRLGGEVIPEVRRQLAG